MNRNLSLPIFRAALLTGALSLLALTAHAAGKDPLIGQEAPNLMGRAVFGAGLIKLDKLKRDVIFELDEKGKPIREGGKYKSKTVDYAVVLNFFATYCVPCIKEIPTFNKIVKSYEGQPVRFVYVNVDTEKSMADVIAFAKARGIEGVDMMLPSVRNAIDVYKIDSLPRMVFIDKKGIVAEVITGFQEDLPKQVDAILKPLLAQG
jgi:thiol-disulfide isomerase/thioredoxin